jgi:cell wall-associated NlpC family hydrolase
MSEPFPSAPQAMPARVVVGVAPLRREPRGDAMLDSEVLWGETLNILEEDDEGWARVRLDRDGYVGHLPGSAILKGESPAATHRVATLGTFLYPDTSIKRPPVDRLSFGSPVGVRAIREVDGRAWALTEQGALVAGHLVPIDVREADPVAVAERFLGVPYLWGGRSSLGIDCSGLVQTALFACGIAAPRDSGDQETALGVPVDLDPAAWRRGDLLFWPGHVALVRDRETFLHANGHAMAVAIEGIAEGLARIAAAGSPLRAVRRIVAAQ